MECDCNFPKMFKIELIDANPGEDSILVLSQVWKFLVHYYLETDNPLEYGKWRIFHSRQYNFYYPTIYDSGICALLNCVGIFYHQSLRNYDEETFKRHGNTCFSISYMRMKGKSLLSLFVSSGEPEGHVNPNQGHHKHRGIRSQKPPRKTIIKIQETQKISGRGYGKG